jgi:DNA ligase-1
VRRFADTCEAVATTKKTEKVQLVADHLRGLLADDAAIAAVFFSGLAFPRGEEKVTGVGGALLVQAVLQLTGADERQLRAAWRRHGDVGSVTAELLAGRNPRSAIAGHGSTPDLASKTRAGASAPEVPGPEAPASRSPGVPTLSLRAVAAAFELLAAERGAAQKLSLLTDLLGQAQPLEAKYIVKVLTGDLRIGLKESLVEEAIAQAYARPLAAVQRANMLTGDIGATLRLAAADRLADARLHLFRPIACMLAGAVETPEEAMQYFPAGALVEDKYDGIRAQVHKQGDTARLYSRTLDEIVEFPELAAPLRALPGEFVLDGEIIAWSAEAHRPLPFTQLQQRLGRKQLDLWTAQDLPVRFVAFDLLYVAQAPTPQSADTATGELLLDLPLTARRRKLESLCSAALPGGSPPSFPAPSPEAPASGVSSLVTHNLSPIILAPATLCTTAQQLGELFAAALARGNEGVVVKSPDSPYTPGRRGKHWLKLKQPLATLDVVVVAVEYGHGKRHGLLSDYTFAVRDGERLLTIGKAYSGLTDAEIAELTDWFLAHTLCSAALEGGTSSDTTASATPNELAHKSPPVSPPEPSAPQEVPGQPGGRSFSSDIRPGPQLQPAPAAHSSLATNHFPLGPIPVEPRIVLEVAFNNIQRSARHQSGFALRFPRIVRLRPDKSPADIDTLARVRQLYEKQ